MINAKEDNTEIILGLHQEDINDEGVKETRPYLDIGRFKSLKLGLIVLKYEKEQYKYFSHHDSVFEREVFLKLVLKKGTYTIVPYSLGLELKTPLKLSNRKYSIKDPVVR